MNVEAHIPQILYRVESGVAWLVIDQPARMNAMRLEMWIGLADAIAQAEADLSVRAIALTGADERAFSAGADISQFGEKRSTPEDVVAYDHAVERACAALGGAQKPTIAVISGICFGGGMELAMYCDLRIASATSRFRIPAARLGLGYGYGGIEVMARKVGIGPVADLLISARIVEGAEALRMGIVNALFEGETFRAEAAAYLARIGSNAPLTLKAIKRALIELTRPEAERDIGAVNALVTACFASQDYREGQSAFREKRDPVFTGI